MVAAVTAFLTIGAGLNNTSAYQLFLNSHVDFFRNNGFVVAFNIILRNDAGVLNSGLVKEVSGVGLLQKGITDVFLVAEKDFADRHSLAVIVVHHIRKQNDSDVFNKVSGTTGLMGSADATFVLQQESRASNSPRWRARKRRPHSHRHSG